MLTIKMPSSWRSKLSIARVTIVLGICSLLAGCYPSPQHMFQLGEIQLHKGKYQLAFSNFSQAAAYQIPTAYYAVGYMYYYGLGVKRDPVKAYEFISSAAYYRQPQAIVAMKALKKNKYHTIPGIKSAY